MPSAKINWNVRLLWFWRCLKNPGQGILFFVEKLVRSSSLESKSQLYMGFMVQGTMTGS